MNAVSANRLLHTLLAAAALVVSAAAGAQLAPEQLGPADEFPSAYAAQRGISLAQAIAMAQGRYQGRVVKAETVSYGDRVVHEIRIFGKDGRVRTVRIDAQSGAFL